MIKISRPIIEDAPAYCSYFFNLTNEDNLFDSLEFSKKLTMDLIGSIPFSKEEYSYADGKFTVKMVFSHIIDVERFYCFYAMCYSRKVNVFYKGFDRDVAAINANTYKRTLSEIGEEFLAVRESTLKLFDYMTDEMLDSKSSANRVIYTPRSFGWMIAGHNIHHCKMIEEKY